jgi:hypothetical protein
MKYTGLIFILFWVTNIVYPDILAYILWGFSILIGIGILIGGFRIGRNKKNTAEPYVKFGNYKIYR